MAESNYHRNDCKLCAPLIETFKKKFNREPDLNEFMVVFFRWAKNGNFGTVEGAERALKNIDEKSCTTWRKNIATSGIKGLDKNVGSCKNTTRARVSGHLLGSSWCQEDLERCQP